MGINYGHPGRQPQAAPQPPPEVPSQHRPSGEPGLRPDIARAIEQVPPNIRAELQGVATAALAMLNRCLPPDEPVTRISSVAATDEGSPVCVLAITDRRLVFVAPAPQAVAWRLASLKRIQLYLGLFFLEGDAGDYSLGMKYDDWGKAFEHAVNIASAEAVLAGR